MIARQSLALSLAIVSGLIIMPISSLQRLAGKRVMVTGAGRGIGQAIAVICTREGAKVAAISRTMSELEETKALALKALDSDNDSNDVMDLYLADVTKQAQITETVQAIVKKWGGIDILINNAGRGQAGKGPSQTLDSSELQNLLNLNVVSVHMVTSAVVNEAMIKTGGKIVNISSRAGKVGLPNVSFYVASKFALEGLSASMAEEWKDHSITVNTLSPGMVNTQSFPKPEGRKGVRTALSVEDGLMTLLLADNSVTGQYLHVDELDQAREAGLEDTAALKPIREAIF